MNCWLVVALPMRATGTLFCRSERGKGFLSAQFALQTTGRERTGGTIMRKLQFVKLALIGFVGAAAMVLEASDLFAAGKPAEKAVSGGDAKLVITRSPS